jgi:KDO2-lipid IV(A) lauroyltransferase
MWKYLLFKACLLTIARLPTRVLYALVVICADLVYALSPRIRSNVWDNARHVLGPDAPRQVVRREARRSVRNVAKYYADLIRLPRTKPDDFLRRRLTYHGFEENVVPALQSGKGVILASCHFGNPELAIQACLSRGIDVLALTEPLQPARLSRLVDGLRASQGLTFLPVSVASVKKVVRHLKEGKVVALMCDRDIQGPKALLPFFGEEAYMPTGPVEVAMRTGAIIIPVFSHRLDGDRLEVQLEEPLDLVSTGNFEADVLTNAQRFLERFRKHLTQDPGQWAVLEAIWSQPAPQSRAA